MFQNNRTFTEQSLKHYTRKQAFESKRQKIRGTKNAEIRHSKGNIDAFSPFDSTFLPPYSNLLTWQTEVCAANKLASDRFYIKCDYGDLDIQSIKQCIELHQTIDVKVAVTQEIDWFNESQIVPRSVCETPPVSAINAYKSMIMNHPASSTFVYLFARK